MTISIKSLMAKQQEEKEHWIPVPITVNGIANYYELERLKRQGVPLKIVRQIKEDGSQWLRVYRVV
jgi:hypothetical protein